MAPDEGWHFPSFELGVGTVGLGAVLNERGSLNRLGVPPCWRAYFFLLRQEKVAKKKATPGCAVGYANSPVLLEGPGDSLNSPAAQTTRVEGPRPFSVARRFTWGPERRDGSSSTEIIRLLRSTGKTAKNEGGSARCDASHLHPIPVTPAQAGVQAADGFLPARE